MADLMSILQANAAPPRGWTSVGQALAGLGGAGREDAYNRGMAKAAQLDQLVQTARYSREKAMEAEDARKGRGGFAPAAIAAGIPEAQAGLLSSALMAGYDPTKVSGYLGQSQEQGFREGAVGRALAGDFGGGNAYLMGVANGPVELASVQGQNLINNRLLEGGGGISTTEQGRAGIAADAARAASSYASANNSNASAARTRQATARDTLGGGGRGGGSEKPIPVGALNKLLEVEEALGGTNVLGDIIAKNQQRLKNGSLNVGPAASFVGRIRTGLGMAGANDVNLSELNADKTKIVNESLRLNKGVQTEGDAQRAGEELMAANDEATLMRAFDRLSQINARGVELQRNKQNIINSNYGRQSDEDTLGYRPSAAAARAPGLPAAPAQAVQRARNPNTGQVLVLRNGQWVPE